MWDSFFVLNRRRSLSQADRAYRKLSAHSNYCDIQDLLRTLSLSSVNSLSNSTKDEEQKSTFEELKIRQYLVSRLFNRSLNLKLLVNHPSASAGKFWLPFPKAWQKVLVGKGYDLDCRISTLAYRILIGAAALNSIKNGLNLILKKGRTEGLQKADVYLFSRPAGPITLNKGSPVNFWSWAISTFGPRPNGVRVGYGGKFDPIINLESATVIHCMPLINNNSTGHRVIQFFLLMKTIATSKNAFDLLFIFDRFVKTTKNLEFHKNYIVTNSDYIFRPPWTHFAPQEVNFFMYFYSTNYKDIEVTRAKFQPRFGWEISDWPKYLAWTQQHKNELIELLSVHKDAIEVLQPLPFEGGQIEPIAPTGGRRICIFDVVPARRAVEVSYAFRSNYYCSSNVRKFYADIVESANPKQNKLIAKPKRDRGRNSCKAYHTLIQAYHEEGLLHLVDSEISPFSLIGSADLCISLPFTSTAIIAKERGIPSYYYDPTGNIRVKSHLGVLVIKEKAELHEVISSV